MYAFLVINHQKLQVMKKFNKVYQKLICPPKVLLSLSFLTTPFLPSDIVLSPFFQTIIEENFQKLSPVPEEVKESPPKPTAQDPSLMHHEIIPEKPVLKECGYTINFSEVSICEFIRFVSKIAQVNFIYDEGLLNFNLSLISGKPSTPEDIFHSLQEILDKKGFTVIDRDHYFLIEAKSVPKDGLEDKAHPLLCAETIAGEIPPFPSQNETRKPKGKFATYKLRFHAGDEILSTIKQIALSSEAASEDLIKTIDSMQLVKATNSLFYSGTEEALIEVKEILETLDTPLRQVFIEVLVIETDVKNGMEFGLEWAAGGNYRDRFGFGMGNFPNNSPRLAKPFQEVNAANPPSGPSQIPLGRGFDLGIIGDIILHKGKTFFSLGSLVSALQQDGNSTIVINQKLITQNNKNSRVFVGDNIPFTGSVVQTIGPSQQTTSNIEYRDVGVSLNIKPLVGDGDIVTLEITEEISEATSDPINTNQVVNGIQTTKTDMITNVHVPDNKFLVLSGMIRNSKAKRRSGIPCLGGLPLIGAAFSKNNTHSEKRNIIIFVKPQIINSFDEYQKITVDQEELYKSQTDSEAFQEALDLIEKTANP